MVGRVYLDTSVAVHALHGTPAASAWFDATVADPGAELVSSRLLRTELTRVLRRDRSPLAERELILGHVATTAITEATLTSAEAIGAPLRTRDAIHLATAMAFCAHTVVATHHAALQAAATSVGLAWTDPVAG